EEYLLEVVHLEGPALSSLTHCKCCSKEVATFYRCKECFGGQILCKSCTVQCHIQHPLHHIKEWNGNCFIRMTLQAMGLQVQLGHLPEIPCPCPMTMPSFMVLHINGLHVITVNFCACDHVIEYGLPHQQLFQKRWFPAMFEQPQMCAPFSLLNHFQLATLQAKVTMYDYYGALEKLLNNSGLLHPPICC
ncbi:hypothetical protein BDN71DRAFT_1349873, partial [Pleurotus eryngii]